MWRNGLLAITGTGSLACLLTTNACSGDSDSPSSPSSNLPPITSESISLPNGITLVFEDGGQLDARREEIERITREAVDVVGRLLPINGVTIRVQAGTNLVIPEFGFGGRADTGSVFLDFDPSSTVMPTLLATELLPILAHELHHVVRLRALGFPPNLLDAMILEGLADHFSIEVADIDPPIWSSALTGAELATWLERSRAEWFSRNYNYDAWFFGVGGTIPRWAGYSIGFELVRLYLAANPSRLPSGLYAEPSASFAR